MPFANVERVPGGYVVSRFFAVQAAAQRGMDLLLSVNEAAFEPVVPAEHAKQWSGYRAGFDEARAKAYDAHPGSLNPVSQNTGD